MSHSSEFDSHGHKDHGHVIVPLITLRLILGALLFFTLLTVGAALAEQWLANTFQVLIPQWINVFVAISIATVKTILVVMFFMQLKYDNPMNTAIFIFTVLTVAFFLGFTALDLGNRGTIDRLKSQYVQPGGFGIAGSDLPITEKARRDALAKGVHAHEHHGKPDNANQAIADAGFFAERPMIGSSSNVSRPVKGVTIPGLPGYVDPKSHAGSHADHAEPAKPAEAKPNDPKKE